MKDIKYTTDGNTIFAKKTAIATMVLGSNGYELAVMQGVNRYEVVNKIISDCPEFAAAENITENTHPELIQASKLARLNKR